MGTSKAFVFGTIMGGVAVWLWGKEMEEFLGARTRGARTQAADTMRVVEEKAGQVLDTGGSSLRRAEGVLKDTKKRVRTVLRAGQEAIRPGHRQPRES